MIQIVLHRSLSLVIACSDGMQWEREDTSKRPITTALLIGLRETGAPA
jgi:hypothetical protein